MQVILLERVERLGQMGDTVNVKPGYARNFLLPSGKALRATKENQKRFEKEHAQLEAQNLEFRNEAQSVAAKMESVTVVLIRQAGETGQLYGSVNARDVANELDKVGNDRCAEAPDDTVGDEHDGHGTDGQLRIDLPTADGADHGAGTLQHQADAEHKLQHTDGGEEHGHAGSSIKAVHPH